jgi:hypothetical protein
MRAITQAKENAKSRIQKWEQIANELDTIMALVDDRIGDDAVVDSDNSYYSGSSRVDITIEAEVDDPQKGAFQLMESYNWDTANIKQQRNGYHLRLKSEVRGV